MTKEQEIKQNMELLGISYEEALQMWEDDNETDHMTVSEIKKQMSAEELEAYKKATRADTKKKADGEKRKRTYIASDEKAEMFRILTEAFKDYDMEVVKENKLITVKMGEKVFKVDLIEQRKKKGGD